MSLTAIIIFALIKIVVIVGGVVTMAALLTWADRRQSSMLQDRVGPNRANIGSFRFWGLLHPVADGLKMAFKEDFIPARADRLLHGMAPFLAMFPPLLVFSLIPFGDDLRLDLLKQVIPSSGDIYSRLVVPLQVARLDSGILFIIALSSTGILGSVVAGWVSDNRFGMIGAQRGINHLVSYEVALGLTLIAPLVVYGTVDLYSAVKWQQAHLWGFLVQPMALVLYFAAATAESKRTPFDLPEGESEIVAGYFIEHGSFKFGMFFFSEYIEVVVLSGVLVTLFLGGWDLPFLERSGFMVNISRLGIHWVHNMPHWAVSLIQVLTFGAKVVGVAWFSLMIRWTLPRFRYDQLMDLCWRYIVPLAAANIIITAIIVALVR
jgi:NADH-quinone oxidoreductase subunit H